MDCVARGSIAAWQPLSNGVPMGRRVRRRLQQRRARVGGIALEGHEIAEPWAVFDATLERLVRSEFDLTFVYLEDRSP